MTKCKDTSFAVEAVMANSQQMHILKTQCLKVCTYGTASGRRDIK